MFHKLLLLVPLMTASLAKQLDAQVIQIRIRCICQKDDVDGHRMQKALEDSIVLSDRFRLTQVAPFDVPKGGLIIDIYSISVPTADGHVNGSAMTIETLQPSATERGFFKQLYVEQWVIPTDYSVSDTALSYLASVSKKLLGVR